MKTRFWLVVLWAVGTLAAIGQQPVPPPASPADVTAGASRVKYVTPYSLATSGVASNGITAAGATNIFNALNQTITTATVYVRTNGNNATAIRGKIDFPFLTLAAAQAAMSAGDSCDIGPGQYIENITKTGVEFRFDYNARVLGTLNVTNGTTTLSGPGAIFGESINATNAVILVKNFGLFAPSYSSSAIIGHTNQISIDGCEVVYFLLTDAGGVGASNTMVTINADLVAQVGVIGTNSTCTIKARRLQNPLAGPVISSDSRNNTYITASIALLTDQDQYSVELGAKLTLVASIFTADREEYMNIIGGVTPETDIGQPSISYGTNINFGYWTVLPDMVIPPEPLTRFYSLLGF